VLKNEKDKEENKHDEQISEVQEKHAREIQDIGLCRSMTQICSFSNDLN